MAGKPKRSQEAARNGWKTGGHRAPPPCDDREVNKALRQVSFTASERWTGGWVHRRGDRRLQYALPAGAGAAPAARPVPRSSREAGAITAPRPARLAPCPRRAHRPAGARAHVQQLAGSGGAGRGAGSAAAGQGQQARPDRPIRQAALAEGGAAGLRGSAAGVSGAGPTAPAGAGQCAAADGGGAEIRVVQPDTAGPAQAR
eukprot:scaffold6377_cov125-Isochrysis_galbana.AAC.6